MVTLEPPRDTQDGADPWMGVGLSRRKIAAFLKRAHSLVGLTREVDVLLAGDAELRRLNRVFRGKNKATDVLSFPVISDRPVDSSGDLAISVETAARQAEQFGHGLSDEVCILILHGLLHLSGMDHEVDSGEMAAREAQLRAELKLPGSLIARAGVRRGLRRGAVTR